MKEMVGKLLKTQELPISKIKPLLDSLSESVAAAFAQAISDHGLKGETIVFRKSYTDGEQKTLKKERAIEARIATGGIGLDGFIARIFDRIV